MEESVSDINDNMLPFLQKNQKHIEHAMKSSIFTNDRELIDFLFNKVDVKKLEEDFLLATSFEDMLPKVSNNNEKCLVELGMSYFTAKIKIVENNEYLKNNIPTKPSTSKRKSI